MKIKKYFIMLMKDERSGILDSLVKVVLFGFSLFYGRMLKFLDVLYKNNIKKMYKVNIPVISVGNITLGGTGKTPFTIFLTEYFQSINKKVAILTRGYGKDESKMMQENLSEVTVFVGKNRVNSAYKAEKTGKDIIILDDGFQHKRLKRDIDIILIDSAFLFGNEYLFPRGMLREPVFSIKKADIIVLTKVDMIDIETREQIISRMKKFVPNNPIVLAKHKIDYLISYKGDFFSVEDVCGKRIMLVSGIADPEYFTFLIKSQGAMIVSQLEYLDHHKYIQQDIDQIEKEISLKKIDKIIVTQKDYVKIKELDISKIKDKIFVLKISMDVFEGKEDLIARLNSILCSNNLQ